MYLIKLRLKNKKKTENLVIKEIFLHKSPSKRCFRNAINSLLKQADARGSAYIIYVMDISTTLQVTKYVTHNIYYKWTVL